VGLIKDRDPRRIQTESVRKLFQEVATTSHYEVFFQSLPAKLIKFIKDRDDEVDNKFIFRDLGLLCKTATLPGTSFATAQVSGHAMGIVQKYAHTRIYPDFTMTFIVDDKYRVVRFFELWQEFISSGGQENPTRRAYYHRMEYPVDYKCETLRIQKFDKDHDHDVEYTYINAFPRSLAPVTVSYDRSRLLELSVTFTYDRHFFGGLDRLSRAYRSGQLRKYNDPFQFVNTNPADYSKNLKTANIDFGSAFNSGLDIDYSKYNLNKNFVDPKLKTKTGDFDFNTNLNIDYTRFK
tara:strand:+ start:1419 stop:2297 length:879 start_codon:yes stop_codon:yes gene_type:complete